MRDEARRNGNVNWDDGCEILARFLRDTLVASGLFAPAIVEQIDRDVARLLDFDVPETDDEPYDRLTDRVVEWAGIRSCRDECVRRWASVIRCRSIPGSA